MDRKLMWFTIALGIILLGLILFFIYFRGESLSVQSSPPETCNPGQTKLCQSDCGTVGVRICSSSGIYESCKADCSGK